MIPQRHRGATGADLDEFRWVRRPRQELARVVVAALLLVLSALAAQDPPAEWETSLFRSINELPRRLEWLLWPLQQMGMALAVGVGALILWWLVRHWRPPVGLLIGGWIVGWGSARLMKILFGRGRPGVLLDHVALGFDVPVDEFGFPSGHAVVAFVLATVFAPYLPLAWRRVLYSLAVIVCFARVFMGAHMPLDVVAGGAFGVLVGSVINLTVGIRSDRVPEEAQ
jgi:undecaprenyl-diphosphatase